MFTVRHKARAVKARRSYDASLRQEQAGRNHDRIIDVAERHFLRGGYGPTTITAIAAGAHVSVDTVYKSFGGKPGLIRAIRSRALLGEGPVPAAQRSDALQTHEPDARKIIKGWGVLTTEVAPRAAPILLLLRDAASAHPELRALLKEMDDDRFRRMRDNARRLHAAGHLRKGITLEQAAEVLWTYSSAELYELLVLRRGMSLKAYGQFVADAMITTLL